MSHENQPKLRCPACGEYLSKVKHTRVVAPTGDQPA